MQRNEENEKIVQGSQLIILLFSISIANVIFSVLSFTQLIEAIFLPVYFPQLSSIT